MKLLNRLKKKIGRCKEKDDKGLMNAFFKEVFHYQKDLTCCCRRILGERRLEIVEEMRGRLEETGSYITNPQELENIESIYFCDADDLRFEVLSAWDSAEDFTIKESGEIVSCDEISCRPFFLFWPKAIRKQAGILKDTKLPPYFTPWLHEYCHFIAYCLQKHPIAVACNVLSAELKKHGFKGSYLPAFLDDIKRKNNPRVLEMADVFLALGLIDEAQAVLLEDLILRELGFDPKGYTDPKKEANPYCKALEKKGKEGMLRFVEEWHRPEYYGTSFVKIFLWSFQKIKVDKFTTRWDR